MEFGFGHEYCMDFGANLNDKVTSAKFAGPVHDWKGDSVSLYQYDFFQGKELYTDVDSEAFQAFHPASGIISGRSYWTIFE